jgi:hypothetical protein
MNKLGLLWILLFLAPDGMAEAGTEKPTPYPVMAPIDEYLIANAQDEIALARSAAPAAISADAEVMVLTQRGYKVAETGKNGFVCFVERSWTAGFDDAEFWNPKTRGPNCFNPPAARSVLPQYLQRTEWVLAGATRAQAVEKARAQFATHRFVAPEAGSFSLMLSKQGYLGDAAGGPWYPHVMFFVPHGNAAEWAAGLKGSPIAGGDSGPFEPTVLYIPVRNWSDGSPSTSGTEHAHSQ